MAEQTQTNITAYGRPKSSREGGSTVINYTVNGGGYGSSNINARSATINRIKSELIDTNILNAGTGNFVYLVATDGTISTLRGTDLNYQSGYIDELQVSKLKAHELTMNEPNDIAKITTIFNEYLQGKEIVTDYLTVNKAAHFFEVVIDKIKSVGGTIINTACNSTIDYVQELDANDELTDNPIKYRCYFKRTQDDGTHITNDWMVNDQAICQACNLVPGTSYDKGTHYYWRLVVGRNNEEAPVYVNFNTGEVDKESTTQPDYFVVFTHSENSNVIFTYDKTIGNDGGTPVKKTVTAYTSTGDIATDKTDTLDGIKLKIEDTIHGLNVVPDEEIVGQSTDVDGTATNITQKPVMMGGGDATFSFATQATINGAKIGGPTRLNVAFVFDDGTIEFHPIGSIIEEYNTNHVGDENFTALNPNTDYLTEYSVGILSEKNINYISITSDEVNVWNSCHWIDLSNETGEYDIPQHIIEDNPQESDFNMAPVAGDNIVQLGYRYGNDTTKRARASAIIIASYETPDADIKPPSYAQYMDIIDFDLSSHRKTYFDATRFVINNADIEDVVLDTIRIIPEQNPITKDANGNFNTGANGFDVSFLINTSGTSTLTPNVPANTYLTYTTTSIVNPVTVTAGNHPIVPLNTNDTSINVTLYNSNNMVIDTLNVSIILMTDISNGKNGEYDQWAYVNRIANPGYPNENNSGNTSSDPTYPPTGTSGGSTFNWNAKPTTPTGTQNSWMITRHISFDSSNLPVYGPWSYPIRMNGEDGQPGTDGTDFEFIYYKTDTASATNPNNISQGEVSPTGVANGTETNKNQDDWVPNGWTDRPQGVDSEDQYEYMSQRSSYDSNDTKMWNTFTTPALWSKWGENGQDGDGIKYIFTMASSPLNAPIFSTNGINGWNDAWHNRFDSNNGTTNNGHMWYDDSFSPTDTVIIDQNNNTWSNSDVLCSISKTYTKDSNGVIWWTDWSTPKTWAMYVTNGQPGATGVQGDPGDPGEGYILTPVKRTWEVALTEVTGQKYENLASVVTADLEYKVSHWKGDDQIEEVTLSDSSNFTVNAIVKDGSGNTLKTYTVTTNQWVKDTTSNSFKLSISNVLSNIGGHSWYTYNYNYRRIITEGSTATVNALPVTLEVQLLDGQTVINNDIRTLTTEGKGLFITTNSALQSVYQGVGATGPTQYSNYFTNLQQTMKGIELSAAEAIIGSNGAFTTFGSDHLPQSTTEKCFLTAYNSYSTWPGGGTINIYDSSTPTGVYNNNGTVCYDGTSYWNRSTNMPTLNSSNSYLWMVRGYRAYDSTNRTYTAWKVNTPVLYGVWDASGTIYNNSNLAITARGIKSTVKTISDDYVTSTELTQTSTEIKAEVKSDISGDLRTTGINIDDGSITLKANKVTFSNSAGTVTNKISIDPTTGTLNAENANLTGKFVANNSTYATNVTIDNSAKPHLVVNAPQLVTDEQTPGAATTTMVDITTEYAVNNDIQGEIDLYWPHGNQKIEINAAGGITKRTSNNSEYISWDDIISGVRNSKNYIMDVHNTNKWNSGISGLNGSYTIDYMHADDDIYLFTVATADAVFDIRSTIRDNQGNYPSTGKYNGRIIRIHGYPGLCICSGDTNDGTGVIITKDTYYGGTNSSIEMLKLGSTSNSAYNAFTHSSRKKTVDYWTITLVQCNGSWYEI